MTNIALYFEISTKKVNIFKEWHKKRPNNTGANTYFSGFNLISLPQCGQVIVFVGFASNSDGVQPMAAAIFSSFSTVGFPLID